MNQEESFLRNEPPSASEAYFCLGLGYLEGYNNPVIIEEVSENYHLGKTEKAKETLIDEEISTVMFATGTCWPYDRNIPQLKK